METLKILTAEELLIKYKCYSSPENYALIEACFEETHKRYARQQEELQRQGFSRFLKFVIKD